MDQEELEQNQELEPEQIPEPKQEPEAAEKPAGARPARQSRGAEPPGRELYSNIRFLAVLMAVLILFFTFVARFVVVSGASMENTLLNGDVVLVWRLGYAPKQNDIVVLTQKTFQEDSIIKRVIAVEGQTVDIDYDEGIVYVDGEPLDEPYIKEQMRVPGFGEGINHVTVPEGCIFVMGDNRNNSGDSRLPSIGIIDDRCVIGKSVMVCFPFGRFKAL